MNIDFSRRLLLFVILLLTQALVLSHIHLFGVATPMPYIYFVTSFKRNYPKWAMLVWSFALGLGVDVFSNTPGVGAASMTLIALLQPYALKLFIQRDSDENLRPSITEITPLRYITYVALLTLTYCLAFFSLEMFTFFNWTQWALNILGSAALSAIIIVVVDNLRGKV
ncbi:rod shape-determining protein MreD [Prevotella sp. S7-1-8]|uniref:rod shape-determining protein MreD n=1 Tax=Prevotella sp. S7-1-8 TaxID=1284775 RepID=UPI00050F20E3|nr:rod shape-determining protein MreD [Prevotella sp. S7-1-8]KGF19067.1 rod shape-determining protein MreD [Prevotella sp. S7-1-8]